MSKDTSFHEHFRIQDIKYNRTGEDRGAAKKPHPERTDFRAERGAPEKVEEDVGGAYFDDAFEEQRSYARKDVSVSQVFKGIRWMPWRSATTKDAVSCEKTWGAASRQRTMYLRMGQPAIRRDSIVKEEKPGELKHLSNRRKRNQQRSTRGARETP